MGRVAYACKGDSDMLTSATDVDDPLGEIFPWIRRYKLIYNVVYYACQLYSSLSLLIYVL